MNCYSTEAAMAVPIVAAAATSGLTASSQNIGFVAWYLMNLWTTVLVHQSNWVGLSLAGLSLGHSNFSAWSWKPPARCLYCRKLGCRIGHSLSLLVVDASSHLHHLVISWTISDCWSCVKRCSKCEPSTDVEASCPSTMSFYLLRSP